AAVRRPAFTGCGAQRRLTDTVCCVSSRVREPVISGRKDRFAYSLIVIHFRKILNPIKIGLWKNSYPVI
ncbi:hypothetical protein ACUMMF_004852, partial [Salmonella enterica subsp. enterica serovar Kentucky]